MDMFVSILRIVHITAGCLALLSGLGAILARKNILRHLPFGKFYFWCMFVIFLTALYLSVYRQNTFLFFIAVFTFHAALTALRSLKLKKLHLGQKPRGLDWWIEALNIAANLGLVGIGIKNLFYEELQWGIISIFFGSIGIRNSFLNIRRLRGKVKESQYWLLAHIGGMMASYIGALTAFLVNNNRWLHLPNVVVWLLPTFLLLPFIISQSSRIKKAGGSFV